MPTTSLAALGMVVCHGQLNQSHRHIEHNVIGARRAASEVTRFVEYLNFARIDIDALSSRQIIPAYYHCGCQETIGFHNTNPPLLQQWKPIRGRLPSHFGPATQPGDD
jgi:hypothetical protein